MKKALYYGTNAAALFLILAGGGGYLYYGYEWKPEKTSDALLAHAVKPQSFLVDVHAMGELDAARSTVITSVIPSDNSKIVYIVADGSTVNPGDTLVKIDPTPYEVKASELRAKVADHQIALMSLEKNLEWETHQTEIEAKIIAIEIDAANLELDKIIKGDGPMEISRLKAALVKSKSNYEELAGYFNDLQELEKEGFVNFGEIKQAQKKLDEAKEAFEVAAMQHDSYVNHVYPMHVKKGETQITKLKIKQEEIAKSTEYRISKAETALRQARAQQNELENQLKWAEWDLSMTEVKAQTPGMVVLRDEFRQGQRRKPRIGDLAVKNQPLLDLPDLQSLIVKSKVREIDLHKIELGKPATIEVDAYPDVAFPGKIIHIGVLALPDTARFGEEKYFEVHVAIDKQDSRLRPGMTARLVVHAGEVKEKLSVPLQAVFDVRKQSFCYVKTPLGYASRQVQTGAGNEQWIEITSGLEEGDLVCLSSPQNS